MTLHSALFITVVDIPLPLQPLLLTRHILPSFGVIRNLLVPTDPSLFGARKTSGL